MLAVILKNTILVVLMICIGFFLIDNHLQEVSNELKFKHGSQESSPSDLETLTKTKPLNNPKPTAIQDIIESSSSDEFSNSGTTDAEPVAELPCTEDNMTRAMKIRIDDNMKEIYEYVFSDHDASDELTTMYETPEVPDKIAVCSSETTEKTRYDTMCKNPIKEHHDNVDYKYISIEPAASSKSILNSPEESIL